MALNILIVDDSAVTRAMVRKILGMSDVPLGEVVEAGNGQEGLDALETHWVDVVLADINMPVMNGEEMIDRIRTNPVHKDLPVIVVSTEGSQTRIERLISKGVKFIHKPFNPETVREVIQEITGILHERQA